jgi:hypothetical protein
MVCNRCNKVIKIGEGKRYTEKRWFRPWTVELDNLDCPAAKQEVV